MLEENMGDGGGGNKQTYKTPRKKNPTSWNMCSRPMATFFSSLLKFGEFQPFFHLKNPKYKSK
jgi:hypothetical protein